MSQKRMEPYVNKGRNQKHNKLLSFPAAWLGAGAAGTMFSAIVHTGGQNPSSCWREWGVCTGASSGFAVEQQQGLCICECAVWRWAWKLTIFGNVSALAPCCWQLRQPPCQPQRVIDASSPWPDQQSTVPLKSMRQLLQQLPSLKFPTIVNFHSLHDDVHLNEGKKCTIYFYFQMKLFLV